MLLFYNNQILKKISKNYKKMNKIDENLKKEA